MKTARFIHIDMAWTGTPGKPFQWYAWGLFRELQRKFGVRSRCSGPCKENETITEDETLFLLLPWKGFQAKRDFRRLQYCLDLAGKVGSKVVCIADDPYRIQWAGPYIQAFSHKYPNDVFLVSNYTLDPTIRVEGWDSAKHIFWPSYPFDQILKKKDAPLFPKYRLGYVGRFIEERSRLFAEKVPADAVLIGPQWDRQSKFKAIFTEDGGLEWYDLDEAYSLCSWHLMVSDSNQTPLRPAVSRVGEALACNRPLLFHESCMRARPDILWSSFVDWIWKDRDGLEDRLNRLNWKECLADQQRFFLPQYYPESEDITILAREALGCEC